MFASRTPRDLNHDPFPWAERGGEVIYDPRPGFDHVQHNSPNPVLVEFRSDVRARREHPYWGDTYDSTMDWLDHAHERDAACRERGITADHITHARRVLTRLANLTKEP